MRLVNPNTGMVVTASPESVDRLLAAGFKKEKPEVAPVKGTAKDKPSKRKSG